MAPADDRDEQFDAGVGDDETGPGGSGDAAVTWSQARSGERSANSVRAGEVDDLAESVAALSQLSSRDLGLKALLRRVATFAVRAIPGAEGAGLTLLEEARPDTLVTTAGFVSEVDEIQYRIGEGPCISAAADGVTVVSGSLGSDQRWPRFGGGVARLGVHSALSLPLVTADGVVGAMNIYAHGRDVFDDRSAELGELFAIPAAIAVQNAQVLAQAQRLAARLQAALDTRSIIDRAVGIMMSRSGGTAEQAVDRLRTLSQHEHQRLTVIAQQLVDEAASRARSRHTEH